MDKVLTVNEYYDGPRLGIAEYNGIPHIYESEYDYSTETTGDTYWISLIGSDLYHLIMEDWEIWIRWETAFKSRKASRETHPALPIDRKRHDELKLIIGDRLKSDPNNRKLVRASFDGDINNLFVKWQEV